MPEQTLRQELVRLHQELDRASRVDPPSRELLEQLSGDIQRLLDAEAAEADDSLSDRLADAVHHFEESHPSLAVAVGRIATALSNLGI